MRFLKFDDSDLAQRRYALIQLSFQRSRRPQKSAEDLAVMADMVKAVNAIGVEYDEDEDELESQRDGAARDEDDEDDEDDAAERRKRRKIEGVAVGTPMRRLQDGGGTVKLQTSEWKMLKETLLSVPWTPQFALDVNDLKTFISKASKDRKRAADEEDDTSASSGAQEE